MQKIRKNDMIQVIAGSCKGQTGKIKEVLKKNGVVEQVLVEGINLKKKHVKPNPNTNEPGGIVSVPKPIDVSNVAIYNPATKKADKVAIKTLADGSKVRIYKSTQEQVEVQK